MRRTGEFESFDGLNRLLINGDDCLLTTFPFSQAHKSLVEHQVVLLHLQSLADPTACLSEEDGDGLVPGIGHLVNDLLAVLSSRTVGTLSNLLRDIFQNHGSRIPSYILKSWSFRRPVVERTDRLEIATLRVPGQSALIKRDYVVLDVSHGHLGGSEIRELLVEELLQRPTVGIERSVATAGALFLPDELVHYFVFVIVDSLVPIIGHQHHLHR